MFVYSICFFQSKLCISPLPSSLHLQVVQIFFPFPSGQLKMLYSEIHFDNSFCLSAHHSQPLRTVALYNTLQSVLSLSQNSVLCLRHHIKAHQWLFSFIRRDITAIATHNYCGCLSRSDFWTPLASKADPIYLC